MPQQNIKESFFKIRKRIIIVFLTQGSVWHVLPKGLLQAANLSGPRHTGNTTPCLQCLQRHTQFHLACTHSR